METYTILDFTSGLKIAQLSVEITQNPGILTSLLGITRETTQVYILFSATLSIPEKLVLDSIVAAHVPIVITDAVPGVGALVRYMSIFNPTTPLGTSYTTIASNLWDRDRYSNFDSTGKIILTSTVIDNPLEIRIWDTVNTVSLGYYQSNASESQIVPIALPVTNTTLEIQIKKTNTSGTTPILNSIVLEFIC